MLLTRVGLLFLLVAHTRSLSNDTTAQVLVLGVVMVQVYLAVPSTPRWKPANVAGRRSSLLRPSSSWPSESDLDHHLHQQKARRGAPGGEEEEEEEEETHQPRRRLDPQADVSISLNDRSTIPECPAAEHQPNSMADDRLQSTVTVGTAEVWAKLQLAEPREECRAEGSCCRVSEHDKHQLLFVVLFSVRKPPNHLLGL